VLVHLYVSSLGYRKLVCLDPGLVRLPASGAPWRYLGAVPDDVACSSLQVKLHSALSASGIFVWPPLPERRSGAFGASLSG
jgi:hypothetical protein